MPANAITEPIFKCPKCQNCQMALKSRANNAGFYVGCQGFPNCKNAIWLTEVKEIRVTQEECETCRQGTKKVALKFKQNHFLALVGSLRNSRIDGNTYTTCFICDEQLRHVLNINVDCVKRLGNVVDVGNVGNQRNNQNPRNPPPNSQNRGWGNQGNNNRNDWGDDDDDFFDGRGGGAIAASSNTNRGWNSNANNNNNNASTWGRTTNPPPTTDWRTSNDWNSGPSGNSGSRPPTEPPKKKRQSFPVLDVNCGKCGNPCPRRIVKKEGINKGRPFYSCENPNCKFFKWGDENLPTPTGKSLTLNLLH